MGSAIPGRTLVASAHPLVRAGLALLLRQALPDAVQSEAASIEQLLLLLTHAWPNLLLLDFALLDGDPAASLRRIRSLAPGCRILLLTEDAVSRPELRAAGATIIAATGGAEDLVDRIRICLGRAPLPAPGFPQPSPAPAGLTSRQAEVFRLLAEGCSTKTIARRLDLAVGTVKVHLAAIYRALGATSRLEAVVKARGLVAPTAPPPDTLPLFNWQWDSSRSRSA